MTAELTVTNARKEEKKRKEKTSRAKRQRKEKNPLRYTFI